MQPARYIPRYTYADYLQWEGNWELIDGIPHAMSPSPTRKHQILSYALNNEIVGSLKSKQDKCNDCVSLQDVDWVLDDDSILKPDIAVVCEDTGDYIKTPPSLIIEILSPSSGRHDRITKHAIYASQGVKYYIIVDPLARSYSSYILRKGKYEKYLSDSFEIHEGCTIKIDVSKVLEEIKN